MDDATWTTGSDMVSWSWRLPMPPPEGNGWVVDLFVAIRNTLGDFGTLSGVILEFMHDEDKPDRFELPVQWEAFLAIIGETRSLQGIYVSLNLHCVDAENTEFSMRNAGSIGMSMGRYEDGINNQADAPQLNFSIDTDIYDPNSLYGDNELVAAKNAPRLAGFLHRIEELPAEFLSADQTYRSEVHRYGFTIDPVAD